MMDDTLQKLLTIDFLSKLFDDYSHHERGTGRTTMMALTFLHQSLRYPTREITVIDHSLIHSDYVIFDMIHRLIPYQHQDKFRIYAENNKNIIVYMPENYNENLNQEIWISILKNSGLFSPKELEQVDNIKIR